MTIIPLTPLDLTIASGLIGLLVLLSWRMRLGLIRQLIIAALRTTVQLLLIGMVLKVLFASVHLGLMAAMAMVMLFAAGRQVLRSQKRRFAGWWGMGLGSLSMFISSFTITLFALNVIIAVKPWYTPQYAIPLLGMLLGNTMNGVSLGLDRLTVTAWDQRSVIEGRLMLGQTRGQAIAQICRESIRGGLIPIINSMTVAGLVSLPGMMTGQILGGNPPLEAVKYQILIMFLIAGGTGLGTMGAVWLGSRRLFDNRHRLRLDHLR
jgi:putative ABC transport system permease protein